MLIAQKETGINDGVKLTLNRDYFVKHRITKFFLPEEEIYPVSMKCFSSTKLNVTVANMFSKSDVESYWGLIWQMVHDLWLINVQSCWQIYLSPVHKATCGL